MAAKAPLRTPSLTTLADQLARSCYGASNPQAVPLLAAATGVALLGAPADLRQALLVRFGAEPGATTLRELSDLWTQMQKSSAYLIGFLDPLLGWVEKADPRGPDAKAFARCCSVLAGVDLTAVANTAHGDILGPLYTFLRSHSHKQQLGAFFTPPDVASLIAALSGLREGTRVLEPACGAGGMVLAYARQMREAGLDPDTCTYVLNDIDPMAVALAGVNLSAHGLTRVQLRVGDALTFGADQ